MAFRFWRRVKIAPGMTLNLSKSGGSLSFGPRGARLTVGPRGRRTSVGIPGTGLFYTTTGGPGSSSLGRRGQTRPGPAAPGVRPQDRLSLGFFKRLVTPAEEQALVDGCRELLLGNESRAREHLEKATHLADGAFLAGFLDLQDGRLSEAVEHLSAAAEKPARLGRRLARYGIGITLSLPITAELSAHVGPGMRGVLLGLVEAHQGLDHDDEAMECLERLRRLEPNDVVVKLSLAELILGSRPEDREACRRVIRLAKGIENASAAHAALLLYKARALRTLGLHEAAREALTAGLRRRKDRPQELLHALRYERALVYEELAQHARARRELERIFSEDPDYEDVARRLGQAELGQPE